MSEVTIGSARIDERGKALGGQAGDQKQTGVNDYKGEVSMQDFYVHSKGWIIARLKPKYQKYAIGIASCMIIACNNKNIGYNQAERTDFILDGGVWATKPTSCDCSALVRDCVLEATGVDPGNFTTATEVNALLKTGLFDLFDYKVGTPLYTGDILVTKSKGHTAIVTSGLPVEPEVSDKMYPAYRGGTTSIVSALAYIGEPDTSFKHREKIARKNKIKKYTGTAAQNTQMLNLLKLGKLKKA